MNYRFLANICTLAVIAALLPGQTSTGSPNSAPPKTTAVTKKPSIPRTADGHPDLQGVWTNATLTPLARPDQFAAKATVSDEEARAFEKKDLEVNTLDSDVTSSFNQRTGGPGVGAYN